jgi:hypothetical protein
MFFFAFLRLHAAGQQCDQKYLVKATKMFPKPIFIKPVLVIFTYLQIIHKLYSTVVLIKIHKLRTYFPQMAKFRPTWSHFQSSMMTNDGSNKYVSRSYEEFTYLYNFTLPLCLNWHLKYVHMHTHTYVCRKPNRQGPY